MVVVDFEKIRPPVSTINPSLSVLPEVSEPSLLLMDFLLTMQDTAVNATYFGGRIELIHNLHRTPHRVTCSSPGARRLSTNRTREAPVRRLLFPTFADRRTIG